jgi:hypothetical protein
VIYVRIRLATQPHACKKMATGLSLLDILPGFCEAHAAARPISFHISLLDREHGDLTIYLRGHS